MINRQKIIGWVLVIISSAYLVYFLKIRVLTPGPLLEKKDWFNLITSIGLLIIGTVNVRLAAIREQRRRQGPTE
ncbi:MAG: hypothetical protein ACRECO_15790 [Xanthobacteraceae bacterium]